MLKKKKNNKETKQTNKAKHKQTNVQQQQKANKKQKHFAIRGQGQGEHVCFKEVRFSQRTGWALKIFLFGLCETRWTQSGQVRLSTGETILYSGHEEEDVPPPPHLPTAPPPTPHAEGIVSMFTNEAQRAPTSWEAVSSRIITAKFRTKMKNINIEVVECHAPTKFN